MVKLSNAGEFLINGTEVVECNGEEQAALTAKTGRAVSKEEAAENTMAYQILKAHNTSGNRSDGTKKGEFQTCRFERYLAVVSLCI